MNRQKVKTIEAVIVGITHAGDEGGHRLCVGALGVDGTPYRLHSLKRDFQRPTIKIEVGEEFRLNVLPYENSAPHTEGVRVESGERTGFLQGSELIEFIGARVNIVEGGLEALFDGLLSPLDSRPGAMRSLGVREQVTQLDRSVEFARLDFDLTLENDEKYFANDDRSIKVRWVGQQSPPDSIPAGTLARFSLATWWGTPPHDAYYLQLSGVFEHLE